MATSASVTIYVTAENADEANELKARFNTMVPRVINEEVTNRGDRKRLKLQIIGGYKESVTAVGVLAAEPISRSTF